MKVLVTGASSGVGTSLATALRARGDSVVALVRRTSQTEMLFRLGCALVEGEVNDTRATRRAAAGCDAVIHAAAKVGDWGAAEEFRRTNVEGTECVLRAARDEGATRFVLVSSVAVYGPTSAPVLDESLPMRESAEPYADSKIEAERRAFTLGASAGLAVTAVRPCLVYGPHDKNFIPRLVEMLRKGRFVYPVDPASPINLVSADHVVDVCLRAMESPRAVGEAFNAGDGETIALREIVQILCKRLRVREPEMRVPTDVAIATARAMEKVWSLARIKSPPPLTQGSIRIMSRPGRVSIDKAREVLGFIPTVTSAEGVARVCDALT